MASETGGDVVAQVNNTAGRRGSNASEASAATNASRRGSTVSTSSDGTESTINSPTIASPLARVPLLADPDVPRPEQNRVAERSLIGLLQMLIEITINATLNPWRKHPAILARMPDFEIKLGFGLHMGWAVEGALGSEQKIDASYLGAHVNLSMFLEEHTKEYGVPLLMSGEVYDLLCPTVQMRCRWLDSMSVVGRDEPLDIFTFDYTLEGIGMNALVFL
jgi:class 3 adenylate cyclase